MRVAHRAAAALLASGLTVTGCSSASSADREHLTVFAAASLQESFDEIGAAFRTPHPDCDVTFNYGGSSTLAQQIVQGAPADVFATASATTMKTATSAGAVGAPVTFATNTMELVVPPANPGHITALADLTRPGTKLALCQPDVPCGAASRTVLAKASVTTKPVTLEADVKSVLTKVRLGEVDAGLVYVTDARAAGTAVTSIPVPAGQNATTTYPIGVVTATTNQALAQDFQAFVTSADGQKVLAAHGFDRP